MPSVVLSSSLTSPPGQPIKAGSAAGGTETPLSTTETVVASPVDSPKIAKGEVVKDAAYFAQLLASSEPSHRTKAGVQVFCSALQVVEAVSVKESETVWVFDSALQVGLGQKAVDVDAKDTKVFSLQTRLGAGSALSGYMSTKPTSVASVFATSTTLSYLLPALATLPTDPASKVVIQLATTSPRDGTLEFADSFAETLPLLERVAGLGFDILFSATAQDAIDNAQRAYASEGHVLHVFESTQAAREVGAFTFPSAAVADVADFTYHGPADASSVVVIPASALASELVSSDLTSSTGLVVLNRFNAEGLASVLAGAESKTVHVIAQGQAGLQALKQAVLASLYAAQSTSSTVLPSVKGVALSSSTLEAVKAAVPSFGSLAPSPSTSNTKTVAFYTPVDSPFPALLSHLYLSSPSLHTRLAQYGSSTAKANKSVLTLSSSPSSTPISVNEQADVVWVSDPSILKTTDVVSSIKNGGILVLATQWLESEIPAKLSRLEKIAIKEKNIRVFSFEPTSDPIAEQVGFLLLYTGKDKLPAGVKKVLNAFYDGDLGREAVEFAQAGLFELSDVQSWEIEKLAEGKTDKPKAQWEWDALAGKLGQVEESKAGEKPQRAGWEIAARHLFFREAFAVPKDQAHGQVESKIPGPSVQALRPTDPDQTFLVSVLENKRLTPQTYDRNVFHLELDTSGTGLKYAIGEAIGIHGWNDTAEVQEFIDWYGLNGDDLISFPSSVAGTIETRSIFQLLQQNIDLFGRPGKAFYASLAKLATTLADARTLKFISAPEGAELFKKMAENETVTFVDVLKRFRTARPSIEELIGLIPEIKPRHYSIASSQNAVGDKVELLIVTVDWISSTGGWRILRS